MDFAFHVTKNPQRPFADNLADDRKAGTDGGDRFWRRRRCRVRNGGAFDFLLQLRVSIVVCGIVFGFSEHVYSPYSYCWLTSTCLGGVVDSVETAAKMNEQFATGRFACGCEIVDADLRTDKRDQIALARGGRVRNVGH